MRNYYYYQAFRKTTVQFLDLFNDIKIRRYDRGGNFVKYVEVPVKYSPKEKIWFWLNERKDDEMLPILSVALTGVDYSLERASNKHQKIIDISADNTVRSYLNPVPYDLSFQVSLWSLYMADIDQILEQILPFFQPFVYLRVYSPELNSRFDVKTIFGSASPDHDFEYTDDTFRILKYTLEFTVQGYLFKPIETTGVIESILMNFYTNDASWATMYEGARSGSTFTSGASGESMRFQGVEPWLTQDNDPIYDYEIFQFGERVGGADRILNTTETAEGNPVLTDEGYKEYVRVDIPSAGTPGIVHYNHDIRENDAGTLQTFVPTAGWVSGGYAPSGNWIDHTTEGYGE